MFIVLFLFLHFLILAFVSFAFTKEKRKKKGTDLSLKIPSKVPFLGLFLRSSMIRLTSWVRAGREEQLSHGNLTPGTQELAVPSAFIVVSIH